MNFFSFFRKKKNREKVDLKTGNSDGDESSKKLLDIYDKLVLSSLEDWNSKGMVLFESSKFREAVTCFNKAIEINPKDTKALFNKSYILLLLQNFKEARACIEKLLEINPEDQEALTIKNTILEAMRNTGQL